MSYGREALHTKLTDPSITALLTDTSFVFYDTVIPAELVGDRDAAVNYYRTGPAEGGLEYLSTVYSVNCRAYSMSAAEAIQRAVFDELNRSSEDVVFFVCNPLPVIPPQDETDNYNAPVEVITRGRVI